MSACNLAALYSEGLKTWTGAEKINIIFLSTKLLKSQLGCIGGCMDVFDARPAARERMFHNFLHIMGQFPTKSLRKTLEKILKKTHRSK